MPAAPIRDSALFDPWQQNTASLARDCPSCAFLASDGAQEVCCQGVTPVPVTVARSADRWPSCGPYGALWAWRDGLALKPDPRA